MVGILKRDARGYGEGRVGSRVGGPEGVSREEVGVERAGGTEAVAPRVRRPEKSWKEGEAGWGKTSNNLTQGSQDFWYRKLRALVRRTIN